MRKVGVPGGKNTPVFSRKPKKMDREPGKSVGEKKGMIKRGKPRKGLLSYLTIVRAAQALRLRKKHHRPVPKSPRKQGKELA